MAGIPRICPCGFRVPAGEPCACQKAKRAEADKKRPSARARGYDSAWQKAAAAFLKEPGNHRCARCPAPATVVMHKVSIRIRPDLKMVRSNWEPGCVRCNAVQADEERRAGSDRGAAKSFGRKSSGPDAAPDSAVSSKSPQKFRGRS